MYAPGRLEFNIYKQMVGAAEASQFDHLQMIFWVGKHINVYSGGVSFQK